MSQEEHLTHNGSALKVGIVGCGRIARHHLNFLSKMRNIQVTGLADASIDQARQLGARYGIQDVFSSSDELMQSSALDALHILTPPAYHFDLAAMAVEKGIHCLVEKPLALSFEETANLYAMAERNNVKICPNFIHLFNPVYMQAREAIQENELGQLIWAESYMSEDLCDPGIKESIGRHWSFNLPGGIMQNYITHPLYLVLEWLGRVRNMTAVPRQFGSLPQGLTDHVDVLIEGEKANGKITMTFAPKYPNYYLKLFFTRGTVTIDFVTQTYTMEKLNGLPRAVNRVLVNFGRARQLASRSTLNVINVLRKRMVPYHGLMYLVQSFYEWINGGTAAPISAELALDVGRAEEDILKELDRAHFECSSRLSTQKDITKKEKILITGGTGYVGSEVAKRLVGEGYYVRAFVRETSHTGSLEALGVEIRYGDIREADKVQDAARGMDVIVHIAAAMKGSAGFMTDCSVKGTSNIAEAARKTKVKRVIHMSSFSVYDYFNATNGSFLDENSRLESHGEKRGVYSLAKRKAEDVALANLSGEGPAWTIFRPSLIFGNKNDLSLLIGPKVGRFVVSFGGPQKHLKLVHVSDVAHAVCLALQNESTRNRIYNLSHEDQITVRELHGSCFRSTHSNRYRVIYVPYTAGLAGIAALQVIKRLLGRGPDMNRVRLAYLCRDVLADSTAFRTATNWKPAERLIAQLSREAGNSGSHNACVT